MQWHPENLATIDPEFHAVFGRFIEVARAMKQAPATAVV